MPWAAEGNHTVRKARDVPKSNRRSTAPAGVLPVLQGIGWFDNDVTLYSLCIEYWPWIGGLIGRKITCNMRECKLANVPNIVVKQASTGRSLPYGTCLNVTADLPIRTVWPSLRRSAWNSHYSTALCVHLLYRISPKSLTYPAVGWRGYQAAASPPKRN
jgi:hypothetical protein